MYRWRLSYDQCHVDVLRRSKWSIWRTSYERYVNGILCIPSKKHVPHLLPKSPQHQILIEWGSSSISTGRPSKRDTPWWFGIRNMLVVLRTSYAFIISVLSVVTLHYTPKPAAQTVFVGVKKDKQKLVEFWT